MAFGIKRSPADIAFSLAVREGASYVCEKCGKSGRDGSQMDLSHFFGRRHRRTRWEPLNATCLCRGCHNALGESPLDHTEFMREKIGQEALDVLTELHNQIVKVPKKTEKEIAKHYREELKRVLELRDSGEDGKIDVVGWF